MNKIASRDKIGAFIKQLREEKNMTQEDLAKKLYCSRSNISHIEQGKEDIRIDKIPVIAEFFNISSAEILAGERLEKITAEESSEILNDVIQKTNSKYKKKIFIISTVFIVIILLLFLLYYFFNSYNSIKVYKLYGENENIKTSEGLFIVTKDEIYFNISVFNKNNDPIKNTSLLYEKENETIKLAKTNSQDLFLIDFYGYESHFKYEDIVGLKGKLIIEVEDQEGKERINLAVNKIYENNNLLFFKNIKSASKESSSKKINIPEKIKQLFQEKDGTYYYNIKDDETDISISYNNDINLFTVAESNNQNFTSWTYYIDSKELVYSIIKNDKVTKQGEIDLTSIKKEEVEMYTYFNDNYIKKYLN